MVHIAYLILVLAAVLITRSLTKLHYETRIDKLELYEKEYIRMVKLLKEKVGPGWKNKSVSRVQS